MLKESTKRILGGSTGNEESQNEMEREISEYKEKELKRRVAMAEASKETCNILIEYLKEITDTKRERTAVEIDSVPAVALAINQIATHFTGEIF